MHVLLKQMELFLLENISFWVLVFLSLIELILWGYLRLSHHRNQFGLISLSEYLISDCESSNTAELSSSLESLPKSMSLLLLLICLFDPALFLIKSRSFFLKESLSSLICFFSFSSFSFSYFTLRSMRFSILVYL